MTPFFPTTESGQEIEPVRLRTYARGPADPVATWIFRVYRDLARSGRLFESALDRALWFIPDPPHPPRRVDTVADFASNVALLADFVPDPADEAARPRALRADDASLLFHSEGRALLPHVRAVLTRPVLIPTETGGAKLTPMGYDPISQYYLAPLGRSAAITPDERGLEALTRAFSGVPFANDTFRANLFAWMLGSVLLDDQMNSPLLVVSANHAQVGKSITTECAIRILTGAAPTAIGQSPDEFEKRVGGQFLRNQRFILIDNVESRRGNAYTNTDLARLITESETKTVRQLGLSKMIGQMHVQFALTANRCALSQDLALRALGVRLFREDYGRMEPYVLDEVQEHGDEIYGGLLWLGLQPAPAAPPPAPSWRFIRWLQFVAPRIEPRWGPLSLETAQLDFDDEALELFAFGAEHLDVVLKPQEILESLMGPAAAGLLHLQGTGLRAALQEKSSETAQLRYLQSKLRQLKDLRFCDPEGVIMTLTRVRDGDAHNPPLYRFHRL